MPTEILQVNSVTPGVWYSNGSPVVPADDLVVSFNSDLGEANFGENQSYASQTVKLFYNTPVVMVSTDVLNSVQINIRARATGNNGFQTLPGSLELYFEIDDQSGTYISSTDFTQVITGSVPRFGTDFVLYSYLYTQTWFTSPETPQPWNAAWFFPTGGPGTGGIFQEMFSPQGFPSAWPQICLVEAVLNFGPAGRIATWVAPAWPNGCGVPPLRYFRPFDFIDRGAVSPDDVTQLYAHRYGQPPSGYYIWVIWRALDDSLWPNPDSPIEGYLVP